MCICGVGVAWLLNGHILRNAQSIVTSYDFVHTAAVILVVAGLFLALVGFIGCYGSFWENSRVLSLVRAV